MATTQQEQSTNPVLGISSGTARPLDTPELDRNGVVIKTINVSNTGGPTVSLGLQACPTGRVSEGPHPEVLASLKRSIGVHAEVWNQLSNS